MISGENDYLVGYVDINTGELKGGIYGSDAAATKAILDVVECKHVRLPRPAYPDGSTWKERNAILKAYSVELRAKATELLPTLYRKQEFHVIRKEAHESLIEDSNKLGFLEDYGVDNWQGYYDAMREYCKEAGEEDDE